MKTMRIKPAKPGLIVRDPETQRPLPPEGKTVKWSSFWVRRKIEGAIILLPDEVEPKKKKKVEQKVEEKKETIFKES